MLNRPKISGFTLIRNGVQFDYPFIESLRSILPWVDELVINVGVGTDETLALVKKFAADEGQGKVFIFESVWPLEDPEQRKSGQILATQTNLALDRCKNDWCFYIQADEVFHEDDGRGLWELLSWVDSEKNGAQKNVDAVVFNYVHFYGSYDVAQETRSSYRREMRVIRKSSGARSVGDAQSFLRFGSEKLNAVLSEARIFHYGWVRTPEAMRAKTQFMDTLYHGDQSRDDGLPASGENFRYKKFWGLKPFVGAHPAVMLARIREKGWHWDLDGSPFVFSVRDIGKIFLDLIERVTGVRLFEFKNYTLE